MQQQANQNDELSRLDEEEFFMESDLNAAKIKMIDICRKELIESC